MRAIQSDTHLSVDSTEAIHVKCIAQRKTILMQQTVEPYIAVYTNRLSSHMTNMPQKLCNEVETVKATTSQHDRVRAGGGYEAAVIGQAQRMW